MAREPDPREPAPLERVQREARRLKLSDAVLERVVSTFRAASIDPEQQPLLEKGLLAREVEASGFALDPSLAVAAAAAPKRRAPEKAAPKKAAARAELKAARERLAAVKREAAAADRALQQAQRKADQAASAVREAEEVVAAAERKLKG
jgi:hypothetical protein